MLFLLLVPLGGYQSVCVLNLRKNFKKLENEGIIAKVNNPQGWVSNLIVVEKTDGSIRLCLDPKDLNKVIKRDYVLIPKIEELVPNLTNKKVFSVLDFKDGFFQIELDDKSSDLCTFSSPFGCYKFLRLPMGLSCAPEIFPKRNEANFSDIPGVLVYFYVLLIAGDTIEQHDEILGKVMKRAKELNIKFNQNKIQLKVPEVKYLGYIFSSEGIKPDPDYVQAIIDMPEPRNKTELQRILGMI
ncbi:Transposon Ty3-I Gag-Pol polyprotein [Araneus ventricosus]|uniref:Transposon Ty3-I Gag-Pol polyprotein n=1 Tax=Araneus ventricosus TaxID=182803 RepID=A0A4Y2TFH6_ARAVE|nr:Transposon Ty3-I Gag-Pol polyprotein [Araneus ventricosus]